VKIDPMFRSLNRKHIMTGLMFGLTVISVGSILEIALRGSGRLLVERNERIAVYRYDPELGWFGIPNASTVYSDSVATFIVRNNHWGFRDREHDSKTKTRIAVLGDSFVWGMNVQAEDRFTDRLQVMLPDCDIVNLGVSGYGTDQELLLAKKYFSQVAPDLVLLMFCVANDFEDNAANAVNKGYYKPYFVVQNERLDLRGVPVPKALGYYIREHPLPFTSFALRRLASFYFQYRNPEIINAYSPTRELISAIRELCEHQGARFAVALTHRSAESIALEEILTQQGIAHIEVATDLCYRRLGWHWTPAGNQFVAKKVYGFLKEERLIPESPVSIRINGGPAASRQ
jgi:lysophospholipase L1-like esterase